LLAVTHALVQLADLRLQGGHPSLKIVRLRHVHHPTATEQGVPAGSARGEPAAIVVGDQLVSGPGATSWPGSASRGTR
jgi:hypothetical protein